MGPHPFVHFEWLHSSYCTISDILFYLTVKVPQIMKILNAKSGEGINMLSSTLELTAITGTMAYSYGMGFPFRWGHNRNWGFPFRWGHNRNWGFPFRWGHNRNWASPDGWAVWGVVMSTRWWLLVDQCVLRNWDRILVRAVKGLISRAGIVSICPLLWQRDFKLQQTK